MVAALGKVRISMPCRSLLLFRKVKNFEMYSGLKPCTALLSVQLLLNKYFVFVFTAYFLAFFSSNQKHAYLLILAYVALVDVERTLNQSEFIHNNIKWTFHSSKHDFFSNFDQRAKSSKAIRIKLLYEKWKGIISSNKWNTYHKFPLHRTSPDLVE